MRGIWVGGAPSTASRGLCELQKSSSFGEMRQVAKTEDVPKSTGPLLSARHNRSYNVIAARRV